MSGPILDADTCIRLIEAVVPEGSFLFVPLECYFDESGTHSGSHSLCIAGFIFTKEHAIEFSTEWKKWLEFYGLPHFRMSDCAHGNGPFKKLKKRHRASLEKKLIGLINRYADAGIAVTLNEREYGGAMKELHPIEGGPYSFAVYCCLDAVVEYCEVTKYGWNGKISYFFESGHRDQREANRLMNSVFDRPLSRKMYRYASHAFLPKESSPPLQAADLLAWQWYTDKRHIREGKPRRKDCEALLKKIYHLTSHVSSEQIEQTIRGRIANRTLFRNLPEN